MGALAIDSRGICANSWLSLPKKVEEALDKFNTKEEEEEIGLVIQRIQISALLKEIDVEEMKGLAEQNTNMN